MILVNVSNIHWVQHRYKRNETLFRGLVNTVDQFRSGIYINPPTYFTGRLARLAGSGRAEYSLLDCSGPKRLTLLQPLCNLPVANSEFLTNAFADSIVRNLRRQIGESPYVLWINSIGQFQYHAARKLIPGARYTVVDLSDDFATFENAPHAAAGRTRNLISKADTVFYVNEQLGLKYPHPGGVVFGNGVAYDVCRNADPNLGMPPLLPKPPGQIYAGFTGGLHSVRVDWPLLKSLFERFPHYQFVFAGETNQPQLQTEIRQYSNTTFLPAVPYEQMASLIKNFDVAIVPHVDNEHTRGNDLLKLLDYFACGTPVVSTRCSNVERYGDALVVADTSEAFADAMERVVSGERREEYVARGLAIAERMAWSRRIADITALLPEIKETVNLCQQ